MSPLRRVSIHHVCKHGCFLDQGSNRGPVRHETVRKTGRQGLSASCQGTRTALQLRFPRQARDSKQQGREHLSKRFSALRSIKERWCSTWTGKRTKPRSQPAASSSLFASSAELPDILWSRDCKPRVRQAEGEAVLLLQLRLYPPPVGALRLRPVHVAS